jgi:hypothetical protein
MSFYCRSPIFLNNQSGYWKIVHTVNELQNILFIGPRYYIEKTAGWPLEQFRNRAIFYNSGLVNTIRAGIENSLFCKLKPNYYNSIKSSPI